MLYRFQTSAYSVSELLPEVTSALEKRMDEESRRRMPGLWKTIDRRGGGIPSCEMTRGRRVYRRVAGILLLLVGLFLLIPGLVKPRELMGPLVAGCMAVGTAVYYLYSTRKKRSGTFEKQARKLLEHIAKAPAQPVTFTEVGIQLQGQEPVPYGRISFYTETPSGLFLNWDDQAAFLQKKDLAEGEWHRFCAELAAKIGK